MKKEPGLMHLLLGLCGIFGIVIAAEWAHQRYAISESKKLMAEPVKPNISFEDGRNYAFVLPSDDNYEGIIERPLLVKGRKPVAEKDEPVADMPVKRGDMTMQLMGVIMTPDGVTALLKDTSGKYQRVRQREAIDGWQVEELTGDRVVLKRAGESHELMLRKPKPKVARIAKKPKSKRRKSKTKSKDKSKSPRKFNKNVSKK